MDDPVRVRVLERQPDVTQNLRALIESELAAAPQDRDERFTPDVLHDERDVTAMEAPELVLMDDVGMANARHEPRLALETRQRISIGDVFRRDDLDRDVVPGRPMTGEEHGTHAAFPELALDDVVALEFRKVDAGIGASCGHEVGELVR